MNFQRIEMLCIKNKATTFYGNSFVLVFFVSYQLLSCIFNVIKLCSNEHFFLFINQT